MSASSHGSTPAAWTGVILVTIAFIIGTLAIIVANWPMFWVGVAVLVLGGIVPLVMSRAKRATPAHH
jgi:hydrogenase-4 membrane subunit HyfE